MIVEPPAWTRASSRATRMLWTEGAAAATGRAGVWMEAAGTTGTTDRGSMKGATAGAAAKGVAVGARVVVAMVARRTGSGSSAAAGGGAAAAALVARRM